MKRIFCLLILLVMIDLQVDAQTPPLNRDPQNIVDPGTAIIRILTPPTKVEGSVDMFEDWTKAAIYLSKGKQGTILEVNYDIMNHIVPVRVNGKEYSLNPIAVDSLVLQNSDQVLVNTRVLKGLSGDALLLRVLNGSNFALYRKTAIEVIKPTYNEALNVGSRNVKLNQEKVYLLREKSSNTYYELRGKKKDFKDLANYDKISTYIKGQNLDLKNEANLIDIVNYYAELAN